MALIGGDSVPQFVMRMAVSLIPYRYWKRGGSAQRKQLADARMLALIEIIDVERKGAMAPRRRYRSYVHVALEPARPR